MLLTLSRKADSRSFSLVAADEIQLRLEAVWLGLSIVWQKAQ
jgi:hypothetical protein